MNAILSELNETVSYDLNREGITETFTTTENTVPVGSYLVVISGAETKIYNAVVASVEYVYQEGSTEVENEIVNIKDPTNLWTKVSDTPTIEKTVSDEDESNVSGNSVNIGDDVTYTVEINPVPNYGGDYPVLYVEDNLSAGLSYNEDLTVRIEGESAPLIAGTDYFLTVEGQKITVNFVDQRTNDYKLKDDAGKTVIITYSAEVNENAKINQVGNNNDVTLHYSNDSKTTGNDGTHKDKTYTYTFDIDGDATVTDEIITKTGEDEYTEALPGAVFGLYTDPQATVLYTNSVTGVDYGNITSNAEGQLYIKGLEAGTYYLKEISAPANYSVNTHIFEIKIDAEYNEDGTLKSWKYSIDGNEVRKITVSHTSGVPVADSDEGKFNIENTKLSSLPSTGGIGTTIFTIGGCAIMVTAAGLYFATRKKEQN